MTRFIFMKEELEGPKVDNVIIAAVREKGVDENLVYNVYLINLKDQPLEGVLVSSKGYAFAQETEEKVETSMLRHNLETLDPKSFKKVEPIMEEVFGLNNEYWVSFWINRVMYDKKFIFLSETIKEENFVNVPLINKKGVMIV